MSDQRTHSAITSDGVSIVGTVHGQGRPLVLLQGIIGDGDLDWGLLLEHLTGRFTCHLTSLRGRGLSGDHGDLSPGRLVKDVLTYVGSIGEPTGLAGWSYGAHLALAVAAQSDTVNAVASVEPGVLSLMDEREQAVLGAAVARTGELAADGRFADAARAFAGWPFNDEEIAVAEQAGYFEAAGRYVPNLLNLLQQSMEYEGPTADDPAVLGAISAPVAVLHGLHTRPFLIASAQYVADHVPHARVHQIPGAGHAALLTHPEALAAALIEFFAQEAQHSA
ncbi:alpha/beta hydrolase [Streptomyces sp. NPDC048255]|uniref:alpha/beta fold hydrolase n=1 Tax=Streptomyces sp. NPDC048255 TaxID=3154713 RepID=UPI00340D9DB1